ncbi:polysaccharide biosynthesis/export family protein [Engelhardtia mirabilis]|uniref:Polysialic acid transport protein KpsD n=1 Tax=Engelhardtia mirabilis TaxID=2528011 RepID=A0A518BJL1_9BACT|nr:Polysialic acid transport protein KpsD precursor [Planctomycetes bacterium Pla133]QDV01479.1 Polysialic acid transport protein KpsD precursor [Planctomycetes bacterium Pla86]
MDIESSSRRGSATAALVAGLLWIAGCASVPPLASSTAPPESFTDSASLAPYTLGPGDLLRVTVFGHAELAPPEFPLRIDPQGNLSLPLTGPIEIAGKSVVEAREQIEQALGTYLIDPAVGLSVEEYAARRAFVLGEVRKPGAYVLDRPITALQALSLAGGVGDGGDRDQVALLRVRDNELQVHIFNADTPGLDGLVVVEPDDLIFVRISKSGAFREQIIPVLQASTPIFGAITNLIVVSDALKN